MEAWQQVPSRIRTPVPRTVSILPEMRGCWHWFWRAGAGYGNDSTDDHIVYGGSYRSESGGNGVRLSNIMISRGPEGARFALIRADAPVPKGHPETAGRSGGAQ